VVLQQTHRAAIVFVNGSSLDLPEIGIAVPLREVYLNAGLPEPPDA
jgi:hypothetical protein